MRVPSARFSVWVATHAHGATAAAYTSPAKRCLMTAEAIVGAGALPAGGRVRVVDELCEICIPPHAHVAPECGARRARGGAPQAAPRRALRRYPLDEWLAGSPALDASAFARSVPYPETEATAGARCVCMLL